MIQPHNLLLGKIGENIAKQYLRKKGYKIIDSNFHKRAGELDVIAIQKDTLVFIEVKCRKGTEYGLPEESVTPWKIRTIVRSAMYYKNKHPNTPDAMRIDVVSIILNPDDTPTRIKHFENVSGF